MNRTPWIAVVAGLTVLGGEGLYGQFGPGEGGEIQRMPGPVLLGPDGFLSDDVPEGEEQYWAETVERALENARSENPDIRRSAVMLLGKYPVPQAQQAVVQALDDPDAGVRQAALVSLFETRRVFYAGLTAEKVLERVGDPDVGIRRIASNVLPLVMTGFSLSMSPGDRRPVHQLPADLLEILQDAFLDEDRTVRRNMISEFDRIRISVPENAIAQLLRDADREVAIDALSVASRFYPGDFLAVEAPELVDNADRLYRLTLARELAGNSHPDAGRALAKLREDEDLDVRLEAGIAYFRRTPTPDLYEELLSEIKDVRGRQEVVRHAIRSVSLLDGAAEPFLHRWIEHQNPVFRDEALRIYFSRFPDRVGDDLIVSLLNEDEQILRQAGLRFLRLHSLRVTPAVLDSAAASRHIDVRRAAVEFTRYARSRESEEVLLELLLDDDRQVRAQALQEIGARRMDGWVDILILSLRDSDVTIRQTALRGLINDVNASTLDGLRAFLDEYPESPLAPAIRNHLARYEGRIQESRLRTGP